MMDLFGFDQDTPQVVFRKHTLDFLTKSAKEDTEEIFLQHYQKIDEDELPRDEIGDIIIAAPQLSLETLKILFADMFQRDKHSPWVSYFPRKIAAMLAALQSAQREDALDYLLVNKLFQSSNELANILEEAVTAENPLLVKKLLSIDFTFPLSQWILYTWASLDTGRPVLDACVRLLAEYFLPGPWTKDCATPFHPQLDAKKGLDSKGTSLLCYLLEEKKLKDRELKSLVEELSTSLAYRQCKDDFFTSNAPFSQPDVEKLLLCLLTHYPQYLKHKEPRSLLAYLALQEDASQELKDMAGGLAGNILVVTKLYHQNIFSLLAMLDAWETIMPPKLKPVFSRDIDNEIIDPFTLCNTVTFVKPSKDASLLSNIAFSLLERRSENPEGFWNALSPQGFLTEEPRLSLLQALRSDSILDSPTAQQDYRQALALLGGQRI